MRNPDFSSVNPKTGDATWKGTLSIEKGDHSNMPARSNAYLPGDERGHVNASSLGGDNSKANVVPQHADLNHGAYLAIENGERNALINNATIDSEKTAVVNGHPGERPTTFVVNDAVTYPDGHTEAIQNSFINESNATQASWNEISASLPDTFDAANPGDGLRSSMDAESYSSLMAETDASLPGISSDYAAADFAGTPSSTSVNSSSSSSASSHSNVGSCPDCGADAGESGLSASPNAG